MKLCIYIMLSMLITPIQYLFVNKYLSVWSQSYINIRHFQPVPANRFIPTNFNYSHRYYSNYSYPNPLHSLNYKSEPNPDCPSKWPRKDAGSHLAILEPTELW